MVYINKQDYLEGKTAKKQGSKPSNRSWWFGKFGTIWLGNVNIPRRLWGKRLCFKVIIEENKGAKQNE